MQRLRQCGINTVAELHQWVVWEGHLKFRQCSLALPCPRNYSHHIYLCSFRSRRRMGHVISFSVAETRKFVYKANNELGSLA